jgi:hypothetical protein
VAMIATQNRVTMRPMDHGTVAGLVRLEHRAGFRATSVIYSQVPAFLQLMRDHIERLQEALISAELPQNASDVQKRRVLFSLFQRGLLTASDARRLSGMDHWEFSEYLAENPDFQRVRINELSGDNYAT